MNVNYRMPALAVERACLLLLALVLATGAGAAGRFDRGLLWRIDAPGASPSYLFGTMHSEDPAVVRLPGPVRRAFGSARAVTLEVMLDPASLMLMSSAFMLDDGSSLQEHVGRPLYRRAVKAMAGYGMPEAAVSGMKPWAVAVTLMTPPASTGMVLDLLLYQRAMAAGKPVDALETPVEQLAVFDGLSGPDQVALLEDSLDNLDDIQSMLRQLKAAYLARDLERLVEISEDSMSVMRDDDPQRAARFNDALIVRRNLRMAERLEERLRRGGHFIAVGALHLPGEQGLLSLLSGKGYRVTQLY